ncbi:hypothetical protein O4H52_20975 [Sphingomonadaceae bacterium G21617-S1]|nr:hypothetical protein [Sphingomonadaceae bacterium G21617-S1]
MKIEGRVWKLGNDIGATDLVSASYDNLGMAHDWEGCARHFLETISSDFPSEIRQGDILVAGENLGIGHAHYYTAAIMGARTAGITALFADSVGALFKRAAIDLGLLAWPLPGISSMVGNRDRIEMDLAAGHVRNLTTGSDARFKPVAGIVLDIVAAGGSTNWALDRIARDSREDLPAISG